MKRPSKSRSHRGAHGRGQSLPARRSARANESLRESERLYRSLFENMLDGYAHCEMLFENGEPRDFVYLDVNRAFEELTGLKDVVGRRVTEVIPGIRESNPELFRIYGAVALSGIAERFEIYVHTLGIWFSISAYSPRKGHFVALFENITGRKLREQQLRGAQKMEAVGRLAGGIAHDFNNLLTVVSGYAEILQEKIGVENPLHADVEEIRKAAERAASLTRQLLAFSRKQVLRPQVLDLNAVVADMAKILRRVIGEDIRFTTSPAPDLGNVRADPGQIEQVLMNLVVNSRDAMPNGGMLTIETANVDLDDAYASVHAGARPGPHVLLAVSDTGMGMDAETTAHIFEPFFTTKERGKGTGLGLATAYGIVKQSEGYISIYSEKDLGTTFKIYLPRVDEKAESAAARPAEGALPTGTETVLFVEDEEGVRRLVRAALGAQGYTLLEATSGESALEIASRHTGPIHLVLTDIVMPGLSGRELGERITASHSGAKILYTSGYTDDAVVRHGVIEPGTAFLQKPFTPHGLARKVREVLDAPPRAGA